MHGRIVGFNGAYTMYVRDKSGHLDTVSLHKGTVINPTGIQLEPGQRVTIYGPHYGNTIAANVIDTPYLPVVSYVDPGWGWW
ncbi:MAG TPA: hypothetical protein VE591_09790 [Candidatus Acidoferrum sp.]|nr:hypothetical protein [Candidatus Acidoferrum sp.]